MPKKNKPNAYSTFMQEYIEENRRKGRNITMAIAQGECDPLWKQLSDEERADYKKRAKSQVAAVVKLTCNGIPVTLVEKEQRQKEAEAYQLDKDMRKTISDLERGGSLEEYSFYIIHVNHFCVTKKEVVPAEISILQFSLECGEQDFFHVIVDSGKLPEASAFETKEHCAETHCIPFAPYADGVREFLNPSSKTQVFNKLRDWINIRRDQDGKMPILFARAKIIENVKGALSHLAQVSYEDPLNCRVAPVEMLLYLLKNKCVEEGPQPEAAFPIKNAAYEEIDRDTYSFNAEIPCQFHATHQLCQNNYYHCSLSHVRRLMFTICDHCCEHLHIQLNPGFHCPKRTNTARNTPYTHSAGASTYASNMPSNYGSSYQSYGGSDDEHEDDDDDGFSVVSSRSRGIRA